jgi:hypothetical protein
MSDTHPRSVAVLKELYMDCDQATAVIGRFGVVVWRGETTPTGVSRVRQMGLAVLARSPGSVGLIGIVEKTAKVPDANNRRLSAQVNDELASKGAVALAAVMPMSGFAGACIRGVVTGLNLMARNRYQFHTFESTTAACGWLSGMLRDPRLDWRTAAITIEEFRETYRNFWCKHRLLDGIRGGRTVLPGTGGPDTTPLV